MIDFTSQIFTSQTTSTSASEDKSLYALAEEKLREKVQQGDLNAIALVLKLQPNKIEVTC